MDSIIPGSINSEVQITISKTSIAMAYKQGKDLLKSRANNAGIVYACPNIDKSQQQEIVHHYYFITIRLFKFLLVLKNLNEYLFSTFQAYDTTKRCGFYLLPLGKSQ